MRNDNHKNTQDVPFKIKIQMSFPPKLKVRKIGG